MAAHPAPGTPAPRRRHRLTPVVAAGAALVTVLAGAATGAGEAQAAPAQRVDPTDPDLGPHVTVFGPDTPQAEIQATMDALHEKQVDAEMGADRHAVYFLPGTYGSAADPLQVNVGYYTEVAGLGASPQDVTVEGADHLVFLDGGRIAEQGTHDELLRQGGRYADFWNVSERSAEDPATT
ncbi:MAG: hypothetical protein ACRDXB_06180 [Actinomycetes bacterium]